MSGPFKGSFVPSDDRTVKPCRGGSCTGTHRGIGRLANYGCSCGRWHPEPCSSTRHVGGKRPSKIREKIRRMTPAKKGR